MRTDIQENSLHHPYQIHVSLCLTNVNVRDNLFLYTRVLYHATYTALFIFIFIFLFSRALIFVVSKFRGSALLIILTYVILRFLLF